MFDKIYKCNSPCKLCRYWMGNDLVPFTCSHELGKMMERTNIAEVIENNNFLNRTLSQQIIEKNIYNKGYCDGRKEAWQEFEYDRKKFMNMQDQEKFAKLLKESMKPLEELLKDIDLPKL